jgi:hypothetical protein
MQTFKLIIYLHNKFYSVVKMVLSLFFKASAKAPASLNRQIVSFSYT